MGVIDSRPTNAIGQQSVRRRRACDQCNHRITTFEIDQEHVDRANSVLAAAKRLRGILAEGQMIVDQSLTEIPEQN